MFGTKTTIPASNAPFTSNTSTTSQPFMFGAGVPNTSTNGPFSNVPPSTTLVNTTNTGLAGTFIFGANQAAAQPTPAAQGTNLFRSNQIGTPFKFVPTPAQATFSTASTTANIFNTHNTTAAINPFIIGTTTPPTTNIFATSNSMAASPFRPVPPVTTLNLVPAPTPITNPFNFQPATTTAATPFVFIPQSTAATPFMATGSTLTPNIFSVPVSTREPAPTPINPWGIQTTGANIFRVSTTTTAAVPTVTPTFPFFPPAATITTLFSTQTNTSAQTVVPKPLPFPFASSATSILDTSKPATTIVPVFNPQLNTVLPVTQTQQPIGTTISEKSQIQDQNIHQRFLAASLLDPYANLGKKDFNNIEQRQLSTTKPPVVSTLSATTTTSTMITTVPTPMILPIQSNSRKMSPSRSSIDVNFKLKPVSSSSTVNDNIRSSNQQSILSTGQGNSPLKANFTDEEELILLSRNKMSKLRLSNDIINSSLQSEPIRSLYPIKRLDELENVPTMTIPSSSTVNTNQRLHSSNENREMSPIRHPSPSNTRQQPSVEYNSNIHHLPILARDDYYMKPTIFELKSLFNDKGQCIVKQFTVGHEKYGSVTFYGDINLAGLNLDEIIEIKRHEMIVYPDDQNKPSVGEELNLPARITLIGVYPTDRTTREEITDIERIKAMNYNEYLSEITKKFDGEFIKYGINDGAWTFMVKHFTRYGLDPDDTYELA